MTDEEIDIVAQELAKIGGTSWYPGRQPGRMLRLVSERYRDQARALIHAFDQYQATPQPNLTSLNSSQNCGECAHGGLMR